MVVFSSLSGLSDFFTSLVHVSARGDAITQTRHQAFIASHMLGGALALIVFPAYLAASGGPSVLSVFAFAWLLSPIAIAIFLSRTGRLAEAHLISAANLAGLVTVAAGITGGLASFIIPWMVIVPLEGALSSERRVVYGAIVIACMGLVGLALGGYLDLLPAVSTIDLHPMVVALLGSASALIYAGGLAISVQTVHNQSAATIRQGERRYRLLAENATDLITRHDEDGNVVFASHAADRVFGVTPSKLLNGGFADRIHAADRPAYCVALQRCVGRARPVSIEFRIDSETSEPARERWAEMRLRPVDMDDTEFDIDEDRSIVAVTRDISVRKARELELRAARDGAESASHAKTQFLATMSHELRTPLNAIIGFADILTRELFGEIGEARYREYARLIHESGQHLLGVVNEILDMSKIEAGKYTIVSEALEVEAMMQSCCDIMRHGAEQKSITLTCDVTPGLPDLMADKRACKQMLLNLLSNAIKFTETGGEITVAAHRADDVLRLQVTDNGIGIAAKDIANLGNPFVQADTSYARKFEGAGLGLCVVTGLARLHGGALEIESEPGVGTTVTVVLPLGEPRSEAPIKTVSPQPVPVAAAL